jgi:hypothetical protein
MKKLEGSAYLYGTTAWLLEAAKRASVAVNSRRWRRPASATPWRRVSASSKSYGAERASKNFSRAALFFSGDDDVLQHLQSDRAIPLASLYQMVFLFPGNCLQREVRDQIGWPAGRIASTSSLGVVFPAFCEPQRKKNEKLIRREHHKGIMVHPSSSFTTSACSIVPCIFPASFMCSVVQCIFLYWEPCSVGSPGVDKRAATRFTVHALHQVVLNLDH